MKKVSILILDFNRPEDGRNLLLSLKKFANFDKEIVYMCNGGESDYAYSFYKEGLIDTLIIKKNGDGGGYGQTDLFRYCKTKFAFFIQVDHILSQPINQCDIDYFIHLLNNGFKCIDLNGDQSNKDIWTDRAHFIDVAFFNNLSPFPNFGPGLDDGKWNEQHLQEKFKENNYKIAHVHNMIGRVLFKDCGKWSVRQAGDGLYKHRCDTKQIYILKKPTYITEVYPPFHKELEWPKVLNGEWKDGDIPIGWQKHSFKVWND